MLITKEVDRNSKQGQEILAQIRQMRLESYTALGWNPYSKENSKLIQDEFDDAPTTTHFAIYENDLLIGSHRATRYSKEHGLPCLKSGHSLAIFKTRNKSISELTRLVLRQDRKYPGCVLQLAHSMIRYTLDNGSKAVCTLGVESARELFEHIGTRQVHGLISVPIDSQQDKLLSIAALPMYGDLSTLNRAIDLEKYTMERVLYVVKPLDEHSKWSQFWSDFSSQAYDYTNLLPQNQQLLGQVCSLVGQGKQVLDAGCGSANLSVLLARNNDVVAYDYNKSMLDIAREKARPLRNVKIRHGDVMRLRFRDNSFDAYASVNVLYHLADPSKAIKEANRVLRSQGVLVITSPLKGAGMDPEFMHKVHEDAKQVNMDEEKLALLAQFNKTLFEDGGMKFTPTMQEMEQMLKNHGFRISSSERAYYDMNFLIKAFKE